MDEATLLADKAYTMNGSVFTETFGHLLGLWIPEGSVVEYDVHSDGSRNFVRICQFGFAADRPQGGTGHSPLAWQTRSWDPWGAAWSIWSKAFHFHPRLFTYKARVVPIEVCDQGPWLR